MQARGTGCSLGLVAVASTYLLGVTTRIEITPLNLEGGWNSRGRVKGAYTVISNCGFTPIGSILETSYH